jgi:hypothetical protein
MARAAWGWRAASRAGAFACMGVRVLCRRGRSFLPWPRQREGRQRTGRPRKRPRSSPLCVIVHPSDFASSCRLEGQPRLQEPTNRHNNAAARARGALQALPRQQRRVPAARDRGCGRPRRPALPPSLAVPGAVAEGAAAGERSTLLAARCCAALGQPHLLLPVAAPGRPGAAHGQRGRAGSQRAAAQRRRHAAFPHCLPRARRRGGAGVLRRVGAGARAPPPLPAAWRSGSSTAGPRKAAPADPAARPPRPHARRLLGCPEGRSAKTWVDFNFFGHQIVAHLVKGYSASSSANQVGRRRAGGRLARQLARQLAPQLAGQPGLLARQRAAGLAPSGLRQRARAGVARRRAGGRRPRACAALWAGAVGGAVPRAGGAAQGGGRQVRHRAAPAVRGQAGRAGAQPPLAASAARRRSRRAAGACGSTRSKAGVASSRTPPVPPSSLPLSPPQWTMFLYDPSSNALEFKAMTNPQNLFAKYFVE